MLKEGIHGFCMALADSVPGVSGGTVAFIMGFYDQFIGSIHDLAFGKMGEKQEAISYLAKLGVGWIAGMALAAMVLSSLFESHIYAVSSAFMGFIVGAIPLVIMEERESFANIQKGALFFLAGAALVVLITWMNKGAGAAPLDLGSFSVAAGVKLFFIGMAAISAMFLPGISGSTLLLIFGAYMPVIAAIKGVLSMELSYIPCLGFFSCGVAAGALTVVKAIRFCLERFRIQTMYAILGMMTGSLYAVAMGPTTLEIPKAALSVGNFHIIACICGIALVLGMQRIKERGK